MGTIPDPVSPETMKFLTSDPRYSMTYGQADSWLSLAQKENDSAHLAKGLWLLLCFAVAPAITTVIAVKKIL